jgi:predicted permease
MLTGGNNPIKKMINPVSFAILLGMLFGLFSIPVPAVLERIISYSSACTGPVSMLLTGLTLSLFSFRELLLDKKTYVISAMRLILIPLAVFGICKGLSHFIDVPASIYPSAVIMAAMPCGLNSVVFPKLIGEDCKPGARLAFITHLFSIVSLSIWLYFLI